MADEIDFTWSDAEPGKVSQKRPRKTSAPKVGTVKSGGSLEKQVEGQLTLIIAMAGQTWTIRDGVCGPVLTTQAQDIAKAISVILADYPTMLASIVKVTDMSKWLQLYMAFAPVIQVVMNHHVTKQIQSETDDDGFTTASAA